MSASFNVISLIPRPVFGLWKWFIHAIFESMQRPCDFHNIHLIQKRLICSNSEYHDRNELWDVMNLEQKQFAEK